MQAICPAVSIFKHTVNIPDPTIVAMAESGETEAQIQLGDWYVQSNLGVDGLAKAVQWYYIAHALGHVTGKSKAQETMVHLDADQLDDCLEEIEDWFVDKIAAMNSGNYHFADPLLRWVLSDASLPYRGH